MKKLILFAMMLVLLAVSAAIAEDVYVQSAKAKVMAAPTFKSAVLGEVVKGHKFVKTGKAGNWMKVQYRGQDAYVSSLLLLAKPPMNKVGLVQAENSEIKDSVRRRASTYTSAAAARGLASDDRRRASDDMNTDYRSLEKIETFSVSPEELAKFADGR